MNFMQFILQEWIFLQIVTHILVFQQFIQRIKIFGFNFFKLFISFPNTIFQFSYFFVFLTKSIQSLLFIIFLQYPTFIQLYPIYPLLWCIFQHHNYQKSQIFRNLLVIGSYLWSLLHVTWMINSIFGNLLSHLLLRPKRKWQLVIRKRIEKLISYNPRCPNVNLLIVPLVGKHLGSLFRNSPHLWMLRSLQNSSNSNISDYASSIFIYKYIS